MPLSNLAIALLLPLALIVIIASIIIGIGELLLAVGKQVAVPLALTIAALILIGGTVASRVSPSPPSSRHEI